MEHKYLYYIILILIEIVTSIIVACWRIFVVVAAVVVEEHDVGDIELTFPLPELNWSPDWLSDRGSDQKYRNLIFKINFKLLLQNP